MSLSSEKLRPVVNLLGNPLQAHAAANVLAKERRSRRRSHDDSAGADSP
jgi:hypothetical protein